MTTVRLVPFVAVLLGAQALANLDNAIVNVATPAIGSTLHAGGAALQLTIVSYVLVTAMLLVPSARLGAVIGQRRLFCSGIVLFTLASFACGMAPNAGALIAARAVQGIGAALFVAQVLAAIGRSVPAAAKPRVIAAYTATLSLSGIAGQLLGGALISLDLFGLSWRPLFLINVPLGIVLAIAAARVLPRDATSAAHADLDPVGVVALGGATIALILPLTLGRELGWPAWSIALLIACVPAAVAFVAWERQRSARGTRPVLALALFDDPPVRLGLLALACVRATYFSLLFVLAQYLQTRRHESAFLSGVSLAIWAMGYGCAAPLYPRASAALARWFAPLGCAVMTAAYALLALLASAGNDTPALVMVLLGCGGIGFGCVSTASMSLLTRSVAREHAADLSGVLSMMVPLMTVVGVGTFGTLYLTLASAPAHAFAIVCCTFAATAAMGGVAARLALRSARTLPHPAIA
jgi:MFS family permease